MLTVLKFAALGTIAGIASTIVGETAAEIAAVAAGVAGALYLLTKLAQALRLVHKLLRHWIATVQVIQAVPEVVAEMAAALKRLDDRMDVLERKSDETHEPVAAIARELDIAHRDPH